jgi:hypothetical protein
MMPKKKDELITQTEAASMKGMTLAAVNELVRRGRLRSESVYGKRLVYRADVESFEPKTRKARAVKKGKDKGK